MKTIKLLIVALLVFAGEKLSAQIALVTNSTVISGNANFDLSCGIVNVPFPASGSNSSSLCATAPSINKVDVFFVDPTCTFPPTVPIQIVPTFLPYGYTYTLCNGVDITFVVDFNGTDYTLTIN